MNVKFYVADTGETEQVSSEVTVEQDPATRR